MPIPVKSISDFFLTANTSNQFNAISVARPDGRFFIGETDATSGNGVFSQRVSADAGIISTRTHANVTTVIEEQLGADALNSGFEAFAWAEGAAGSRNIFCEVRSASGSVITSRFQITGAAGDQFRPEVLGLGDDRFAVAWTDNNTDRFRFSIVDVAGNVISAAQDVSASSTFTSTPETRLLDMAELPNGNFVIAYRPVVGANVDDVFRIFRSDGVAVTAEINVDGMQNVRAAPSVTTLADGRFVVMNGSGAEARIFNIDGTASTAIFPVLSTGNSPQVTALQDGRFMAVATVSSTGAVIARMMFADGTPDGAEFQINTVAVATPFSNVSPSIATLADGRVVVSWTTNESGNLNVKAAVFDPREQGLSGSASGFSDDWVGTAFNDTVYMGVGNDLCSGGIGADVIYGEDGGDSLNGNEDNDQLFGGNGTDTLIGGTGLDSLYGGLGNDRVLGGNDGDTIYGDAGDDRLFGDDGNDTIYSGVGADQMNGGTGTGDSAFYVNESQGAVINLTNQTLNAGSALGDTLSNFERIYGAVFAANTLTGSNTSIILVGGIQSDTLTGGGAFDILRGGLGADTLTGGTSGDYFQYTAVAEGGDTITAWEAADKFSFTRAAFGNLAGANVAAANFLSVASGHAATDASQKFIFDQATDQLWYDADGSGTGAAVFIADITTNFNILNTDLLLA
jgi:hypothetical protein